MERIQFSVDDQFKRSEDKFGNVYIMKKDIPLPSGNVAWSIKMIPVGFEKPKGVGLFIQASRPLYALYTTRMEPDSIHDIAKEVLDELLPPECVIVKYSDQKKLTSYSTLIRKGAELIPDRKSIDYETHKEFTRPVYRFKLGDLFEDLTYQLEL